MSNRTKLRLVSLAMFVIAVVFVLCALSCPTCGRTFYLGPFYITGEVLRAFYKLYAAVMCALFLASFLVKKR